MRVVYSGVLAAVFSMSAAAAGDGAAPTTAGTFAMNDNALKADNPFAGPSTLPYELPPFDRIHDGDYLPAFHAGMREQLKEVERIAHNREPPTFENTLVALERAGQLLRRVDATFGRLNACNTNPKLQDIDTEMAPKLTAQEDGGQFRCQHAALAGAFEGGDDPAGGEVYQGAQLVPVRPVGGPPEDAERRRDDAAHLELPAIHEVGREGAVVPRQGERVARLGPHP